MKTSFLFFSLISFNLSWGYCDNLSQNESTLKQEIIRFIKEIKRLHTNEQIIFSVWIDTNKPEDYQPDTSLNCFENQIFAMLDFTQYKEGLKFANATGYIVIENSIVIISDKKKALKRMKVRLLNKPNKLNIISKLPRPEDILGEKIFDRSWRWLMICGNFYKEF